MLKKISGLFSFITDQGKTRIRRERRRGARGRGGEYCGGNAAKCPSVLPWFGLNPAFQCTVVL